MAATVVQVTSSANNSSNSTYTITVGANVAIGDLIIVLATHDGAGTLTSITDAPDGTNFTGNTYSTAVTNVGWNTTARRFGLYYSVATQALVSGTSKIRFTSGASTNKTMFIWKLQNASTISIDLNTSSANQATTTSVLSGTTGTTNQAKELIIVGHAYEGSPSYTAPAGYSQLAVTQLTTNGGNSSSSLVYKLVTSTGTQNGTGTLGTTELCAGLIATFKYADGVPPVNTVAPAVTGAVSVGKTLTTTNGTWTDAGGAFTYQWKHADDSGFTTNVANATNASTSSTYVIASGENTKFIRCVVTDTDGNGATSANSNVVGAVGPTYAPTFSNNGKIDVCANALTGAVFTPGDSPSGGTNIDMMLMGVG